MRPGALPLFHQISLIYTAQTLTTLAFAGSMATRRLVSAIRVI